MYLKTLELQGFKSFPDKTKLSFESMDKDAVPGSAVTVIVGPNGSGKSNISDAMRWVLGEISSKSLRGSKMEDVIFGGADSRKPMGYAEVSVTFDNTDPVNRLECPYDEVTVTRRYYRAGDSEYFINRKPVRLRDIYEMFMNTGVGRDGYSIIGQGKISEIISKKSDERRAVFEDASGIAKYRHRKTEAERKLDATEENMTRVRDIFTEVESRVGPLEKEAAKAQKAIELLDVKKRADIGLWLYDTEKLRKDVEEMRSAFKRSEFELHQAEEIVNSLEEQYDKLTNISIENKQQSEKLYEEITTQTNKNFEFSKILSGAEDKINHTRELIAQTESSLESLQNSIKIEQDKVELQLEEKCSHKKREQALLDEQKTLHESIDDNAEEITKLQDALETALTDIRERQKEAVDMRVRISVLESTRNNDEGRNNAIAQELDEYKKKSEELQKQCDSHQKTIDAYKEQIRALVSLKQEKEQCNQEQEELIRNKEEINQQNRLRRDSLEQRINTHHQMEQNLEGYAGSVRFVMNQYAEGKITKADGSKCGTIYGPLSQVISVDSKYVTAIETSLAGNLQNIVVQDEQTAKCAMYALKKQEAGRATFYPLTSMTPGAPSKEVIEAAHYKGYVNSADNLVTCKQEFRGVVSSLLGRTVVFDTIDNATIMAKAQNYKIRVVTLDGQQINAGGSFTGGSVKQNANFLSRASEIKAMQEEKDKLEKQIEKDEKALFEMRGDLEDVQITIDDTASQIELMNTLAGSEQTVWEQLYAKLQANQSLESKLQEDFDGLALANERYEQELHELQQGEKALTVQIEELTAARQNKGEQLADLQNMADTMERRNTDIIIALNDVKKDLENVEVLIQSFEERIAGYRDEADGLELKKSFYQSQIQDVIDKQEEARSQNGEGTALLKQLTDKRSELETQNLEYERRLRELNNKRREKSDQKDLLMGENSKNESKLLSLEAENEKLKGRLWDDYEMTRNDAIEQGYKPVEASERAVQAKILTECKNKLRAIGSFDINAVEKYKEEKERYETMRTQIDDMEKSKAELVDIISRLETEMKSSFVTAFNQINENFGKVFAELFGGGSAELSLTDPTDVLESGIEIKAAPPGKIIKSLMQLSGGEQAFVGIALFFAIIQVNPTPFCILDEIEAALDEVNVARFSEYVKRYTGTQFILITHRRGTMEAATRLYGVTMPEHGISKVLALNVADIAKKKEGEWDVLFE